MAELSLSTTLPACYWFFKVVALTWATGKNICSYNFSQEISGVEMEGGCHGQHQGWLGGVFEPRMFAVGSQNQAWLGHRGMQVIVKSSPQSGPGCLRFNNELVNPNYQPIIVLDGLMCLNMELWVLLFYRMCFLLGPFITCGPWEPIQLGQA